MYQEQGQQVSGLLTEEEMMKLEHHKGLNERDFVERAYKFAQMKEDKILQKQMEAESMGDEGCTF
jgi:hypothetical protein